MCETLRLEALRAAALVCALLLLLPAEVAWGLNGPGVYAV